jgi:hypothetical protein
MTDARFPERWLNDRRVLRLSDAGFRLFVTSLAWSVSNRTDGVLYDDDLQLLLRADTGRGEELRKAGLWERDRDRWLIVEFVSTQTTAAQLAGLERKRAVDRERQARHRAGQSAPNPSPKGSATPSPCPSDGVVARGVTRDVARDGTRDTKARPGQARTGQDRRNATKNRTRAR